MKKTETWKVYILDAWRDPEGGWYENNRFRAGEVELPENATNRQILKAMRDQGFLTQGSAGKAAAQNFHSDPPGMWIVNRNTREPTFA